MNKKSILVHLFVMLHLLSFSQTKQIKDFNCFTGDAYGKVTGSQNYFFNQEDEVLSVKIVGRTVVIQKYEGYELLQQGKHSYKELPKGAIVLDVFNQYDRYYLIYEIQEEGQLKLISREIVFDSGELLGQHEISKVDAKYQIELFYSQKKRKILAVFKDLIEDHINYIVLGKGLDVESKGSITVNNVLSYGVNSKGEVFYVSTEYDLTIKDTKRNREEMVLRP